MISVAMADPVQMFKDHVERLNKMRDLIQSKLHIDSLRLVQLGNLLNASIETKNMREKSDLEVGKMIVNWWKHIVENDVAKIDKEVKSENVEILKWWNRVVDGEIAKLDEELKSSISAVPEVPFRSKIEELDSVLSSITAMRCTMTQAVGLLSSALREVEAPGPLLQLALQRVDTLGLPVGVVRGLGELPVTLR